MCVVPCAALMVSKVKGMSKMQPRERGSISAMLSSPFRIRKRKWKVQNIKVCREDGASLYVLAVLI